MFTGARSGDVPIRVRAAGTWPHEPVGFTRMQFISQAGPRGLPRLRRRYAAMPQALIENCAWLGDSPRRRGGAGSPGGRPSFICDLPPRSVAQAQPRAPVVLIGNDSCAGCPRHLALIGHAGQPTDIAVTLCGIESCKLPPARRAEEWKMPRALSCSVSSLGDCDDQPSQVRVQHNYRSSSRHRLQGASARKPACGQRNVGRRDR